MTKREMIKSMMDGKVLELESGDIAYYDEIDKYGPFIYKSLKYGKLQLMCWDALWKIKQEPKKRLMTRNEVLGFLANTQGIVVRYGYRCSEWNNGLMYTFDKEHIGEYEWATITKEGIIGEPNRFEVEE